MASKGYVNKETQILADNVAEPHIYDEGGITDVVSEHITDIVADNAHDIFDTDEVKEAINGVYNLITTIETDDTALEFNIDNIKCTKIIIKFTRIVTGSNTITCVFKTLLSQISVPVFSNQGVLASIIGYIDGKYVFLEYNIPGDSKINRPTSQLLSSNANFINNFKLSFNSAEAGNLIQIWGR